MKECLQLVRDSCPVLAISFVLVLCAKRSTVCVDARLVRRSGENYVHFWRSSLSVQIVLPLSSVINGLWKCSVFMRTETRAKASALEANVSFGGLAGWGGGPHMDIHLQCKVTGPNLSSCSRWRS